MAPVADPLHPVQIGTSPRQCARTSAETFGSAVRPTAAHWVITPGRWEGRIVPREGVEASMRVMLNYDLQQTIPSLASLSGPGSLSPGR